MKNYSWHCLPVVDFLHLSSTFNYSEFLLAMIVTNAIMAAVASCSNAVVVYTISRTPSLQLPPIFSFLVSPFRISVRVPWCSHATVCSSLRSTNAMWISCALVVVFL